MKTIQRYTPQINPGKVKFANMELDPAGAYVLYTDHQAAIAELGWFREFRDFVAYELKYMDSGGTMSQKAILSRIRATLQGQQK